MNNMINIGAMVDNWRATPGAIVHPKLSKAVDAARAAMKANEMTDITERLRRIYVAEGTNYVQEAADLIDKLRAERDQLVNDVHSCGPTCTRAGCMNRRLRDALRDVATQRPWVGLTDDEREKIKAATLDLHGIAKYFATAIEAKLKEKNNAA